MLHSYWIMALIYADHYVFSLIASRYLQIVGVLLYATLFNLLGITGVKYDCVVFNYIHVTKILISTHKLPSGKHT